MCFRVLPFEVFHGDECQAVFFADVVNGADVGMVQRRRRLRFAPEAGNRLGIAGDALRKKLESHEAVQSGILSFVHHTHAAATELLDDAVMRNGLADQFEGNSVLGRQF